MKKQNLKIISFFVLIATLIIPTVAFATDAPQITSINPSTIYAGDQFEINGQGFGNTQETVEFIPDLYSTGVPGSDPFKIISWSNTKITIQIYAYGSSLEAANTLQVTAITNPTTYYPNGYIISNQFPIKILPVHCKEQTWTCIFLDYCPPNGTKTGLCSKSVGCGASDIPSPPTSQSCTPPPSPPQQQTQPIQSSPPPSYQPSQPSCTADTWSCGDWSFCSPDGLKRRNCTKTFSCSNAATAPPETSQYCEPPSRPTQQVPQGANEISNQDTIIKATVKLFCPLDENSAMQGSGTVIDPSGLILTNYHVINGTPGCLIGFINNFNDEPYFGERQIADVFKISSNNDVAILKLRNPQNKTLPYIDITKSDSNNLRLGIRVNIYGYPAKFGKNITYTSGDFSGIDGSYLKTTAIIEHGNSGGGAYLNDGTFIGIPTAVIRGELNALGYILSINTINYLLGNSYNVTYDNSGDNNYSRVSSVLENIDLKKLGSLKLVVPDKGAARTNPKSSITNNQKQSNARIVISDKNANQNNQNIAATEPKSQPKIQWIKRFFQWLFSLF